MFCRHCGTQLNPDTRFCTYCGNPVAKDSDSVPHDQKKQIPSWFKVLLSAAILGLILLASISWFEEDITASIKGQLEALKANKITEAYYSFTSKDFQNATPLETFREFVKAYPIFSSNESLSVDKHSIDDGTQTIHSTLVTQQGEKAQVQYKLTKEGDKWKILSIRLMEQPLSSTQAAEDTQLRDELILPIQSQLEALHHQDFAKAYEYVSKDFTLDTPLEKFETFMKSYPIFSNFNKIEYENHTIHNNRGEITIVLQSPEGPVPAEYKLIKENGKWKIWGLKLFFLANQTPSQNIQDTTAMSEAVKEQISALTTGDIKKAYNEYTTKEFKDKTSLEAFKNFILRHPILSQHRLANYTRPTLLNDKGLLQAAFQQDSESITLEYTLGMEDGKWKIWGMQIVQKPDTHSEKSNSVQEKNDPLTKKLIDIIHEQLNAIRKKDLIKAYHEYTSEGFQKATSLKEFIEFIKNQPGLKDNESSNISNLSFNNNIGILAGSLKSKDLQIYPIEYELIKEDGDWKILHISILPSQRNSGTE